MLLAMQVTLLTLLAMLLMVMVWLMIYYTWVLMERLMLRHTLLMPAKRIILN
jgi:Flp pilus assembly protein TadG